MIQNKRNIINIKSFFFVLNLRWKVVWSFVDKFASVFRTTSWVHKTVHSCQQKFLMVGIFLSFCHSELHFLTQLFFPWCYNFKTILFFGESTFFLNFDSNFFKCFFGVGSSADRRGQGGCFFPVPFQARRQRSEGEAIFFGVNFFFRFSEFFLVFRFFSFVIFFHFGFFSKSVSSHSFSSAVFRLFLKIF